MRKAEYSQNNAYNCGRKQECYRLFYFRPWLRCSVADLQSDFIFPRVLWHRSPCRQSEGRSPWARWSIGSVTVSSRREVAVPTHNSRRRKAKQPDPQHYGLKELAPRINVGAPLSFPFYRHKTAMAVGRSPRIAALAGDEELMPILERVQREKAFPALHRIDVA